MRPLKLSMIAFGPYRDREIIDFAAMNQSPLFVISGATGAGKTTIFDAICFALYGQASGEDRSDIRLLRSQFADEDTYTAVELEFVVGRKQYQVIRQMKHRKAGNKSETGDKQELYLWEEEKEQYVPAVDRFMATEVNAKLYDIIGLTREQFNQIVMLPQGEFRKLLTSDTDNKEEILRKLFQTQLYERLELSFYERNRAVQQQLKEQRNQLTVWMEQAKETLPEREGQSFHSLLTEDVWNEQLILQALQAEVVFYQQQKLTAESSKQQVSSQLQAEQIRLQQAEMFNAKYDQWVAKQEQRRLLEEQQEHHQLLKQKLELANKAQRIVPYEQHWLQQQATKEKTAQQLSSYEQRVEVAERAAFEAGQTYNKLLEAEPERKQAEKQLELLEEFLPIVKTLTAQKKSLHRLQTEATDKENRLATLVQQDGQIRREKERLRQERLAADQATTTQSALMQLQSIVEQLGKQFSRLVEVTTTIDATHQAEQRSLQQLHSAQSHFEQIEHRWISGQAGLLAAQLHDDNPCPVCGSIDHPHKAISMEALPTQAELQAAQQTWLTLERQVEAERAKLASSEQLYSQQYEELMSLKEQYQLMMQPLVQTQLVAVGNGRSYNTETVWQRINSQLDESTTIVLSEQFWGAIDEQHNGKLLDQNRQFLRTFWKLIVEQREQLERILKQREVIVQEEEKLESMAVQIQKNRDAGQEQLQKIQLERVSLETILNQELARIPAELQSLVQLEERVKEQSATVEQLQRQWKEAEQLKQQTVTKLVEEKTNVEQMRNRLDEANRSLETMQARLLEQLEKAAFASLQQYEQAKAAELEMGRWKAEIEQYESLLATLREQLAVLEAELQGTAKIDLSEMKQYVVQLQQRYDEVLAKEHQALIYEKESNRIVNGLGVTINATKDTEEKLSEIADVYAMLKGDNRLKISFERYILIEYLEQILFAANERLKYMSGGQFLLQRSDRLETRGKQSGLGLDVYDAYTGGQRDVRSLSGGEKFNASLCLALGMTDVIQANQGGITIEMMFIDEGFGSLDEEALQKALTVLVDLQKAGRMIGVISHVAEVKQAFPVCIEVTKLKEGYSTTTLILK
ncbi:AAA family ATPase [Paenibacillus yanchengensis]|uniref:Nuclease SbcCD subunit C n=1 Tax=Paenibacillus yanchengensis TaxID=2035833 RepID=A0ABW4YNP0_9BACL